MNLLTKTTLVLAAVALSSNVALAQKGTATGQSPVTAAQEAAAAGATSSNAIVNSAATNAAAVTLTDAEALAASSDTVINKLDMVDGIAGNNDSGSKLSRVLSAFGFGGSQSFVGQVQTIIPTMNEATRADFEAQAKPNLVASIGSQLSNALSQIPSGMRSLYNASLRIFGLSIARNCG